MDLPWFYLPRSYKLPVHIVDWHITTARGLIQEAIGAGGSRVVGDDQGVCPSDATPIALGSIGERDA